MKNQTEYDICKKRGHSTPGIFSKQWQCCKYCGIWVRERTTTEESEEVPPTDQQDPRQRLFERYGDGDTE